MNASTTPQAASHTNQLRAALVTRNQQVEELMPFVTSIAKRVSRDIRGRIELEELVAWGVTGLLEAIDRYDSTSEASLKTYSYYRIRGSMLDNIGKIAPLTRSAYRCAGAAGDKRAIYRSALEADDIADTDSMSAEERVSKQQEYQVLSRAMKCLSSDHRHLVQEHYFADATLKDAGSTLGRSKSWACRSHAAALVALREAMENSAALCS